MQSMLLLKRCLKDREPELKPDDLPENDPVAFNELLLQVLRYYNAERLVLLKCVQVVMLKAAVEGDVDEVGTALSDLLSRLVKAGLEDQLHARLRENLEGSAAAITRRLKAASEAAANAAGAAAASTSTALTPSAAGGAAAGAASLGWLSAAHAEMRSQLISERLELLHCLLLLYEICEVACSPEHAQSLARLLLDRVFLSVQSAAGGHGPGGSSASGGEPDAPTVLSQQLAALLLLSCLGLPGHAMLVAAATAPPAGAAVAPPGGAVEARLPLGGKTTDVHNQLAQYAAAPSTALLLLTWAGCLRLLDSGGCGHVVRDLDGAARELEGRAAAAGGLAVAAAALRSLCAGAVGALLLVYRGVATKALCVLCTAFDLGADNLDPATYDVVVSLVRLCVEGDARACASLWDESCAATAPLRSLLAAAARLFPALPRPLLALLRATAASPESARAAYTFLQRNVSLVVLHAATEPAIRQLGGGEVELIRALPWNLAPSVSGLALPAGCVGSLCPLPAVLLDLRGRYVLVAWDAEVSGCGGHSRGQVLLLARASHCVAALEHALVHNLPLHPPVTTTGSGGSSGGAGTGAASGAGGGSAAADPTLLRDLCDSLSLLSALCKQEPALVADLLTQSVLFSSGTTRSWTDVVAGVLAIGPQLAARLVAAPPPPTATVAAAPSVLQLMADAAELMAAVAAVSPGRVLALLPQLPMFASTAPPSELFSNTTSGAAAPPPRCVPLSSLPSFAVPAGVEASFCGLLPTLTALQRELERPMGRYPLTAALLRLLAGLLERGFLAQPLPAAVLWVLHEVLPGLHQWRYSGATEGNNDGAGLGAAAAAGNAARERWALTAAALRVLRVALSAGAFVADPDLSTLGASTPTVPTAGGAGGGGVLMLTYGNAGGDGFGTATAGADDAGPATLTPATLLEAAAPRLSISLLSAALLKLLLLHGGVLLSRSLPPPAEELERLRADDPSRPELPSLEAAAAEALQLLPPLLSGAGVHPQEQPLEQFLLLGSEPCPAAHIASYVAYHEADRDITPPERQISYLALRALLALSACLGRPVARALPGATLSLAVPPGSGAEDCLRALLRGDAAAAHPAHHALVARLAAEAVAAGAHGPLLDALLFPSELEGPSGGVVGRLGAAGPAPLALPAPPSAAPGGGGGGGGATAAMATPPPKAAAPSAGGRRGKSRQALDGLYATLKNASRLKREHPQVLASALRVLAAMWQQPAAAHRAVSALRSAPELWPSLEACLEPVARPAVAPADGDAAQGVAAAVALQAAETEAEVQRALCEAFAIQILTAEAFARTRATPAAPTADGAAGGAATGGPGALLERLARGGTLLRLLRYAAGDVAAAEGESTAAAVGCLQRAAAALYLEMGAEVVADLWGPASEPDGVSLAGAVRQELSGLRALLAQGGATPADIRAVHDELVAAAAAGAAPATGGAAATHGSPGATSMMAVDDVQLLPPSHALEQLLRRQCLGAALVSRCHVATCDLSEGVVAWGAAAGPPAPLLSRPRLLSVLGPAGEVLQSADTLAAAFFEVDAGSTLAESRLALLQAASALTALLAREGRLLPPPGATAATAAATLLDPGAAEPGTPGAAGGVAASSGAGGTLSAVQAGCAAAVGSLLSWCASPDSRAALQSDWGLRRLHAQRLAAALAASRLLLSVIQTARTALMAAPGGRGSDGGATATAGSGFSTPVRTPGGPGGVFGTPVIAVTTAGGMRGGAAAKAATGGGVSSDPSYLPYVVQLAQQLESWVRVLDSCGLPQCPPAVAAAVTDALAGSLLLTLQPLPAEAAGGGGAAAAGQAAVARQQLAAALLSSVPRLCDLSASGVISTPLAAQLLLESTRHLTPRDWLPLLLSRLDFGQLLLAAAGRAATIASATAQPVYANGSSTADAAAAAGDLGMLALAVAVAQVPDGARALYDRGVVEQAVAAGRHLLSGGGGRLAAFSVIAVTGTGPYRPSVDGNYAPAVTAAVANAGGGWATRGSLLAPPPPDTCGAYLACAGEAGGGEGEVWSPVHRQWCTLLQFTSALLRTLGQHIDVEREALDLLLALEPRLLLAVLPPGGDAVQPLTLAGLVEAEAALFLLCQLTPYLGGWHMVLPASLLNFRTAVSTLLTWLAQPTLAKSFAIDCRPRTAREASLAAIPVPGLPATDGWYRACTAGAAAQPTAAAAAAAAVGAAAATGLGGTSAIRSFSGFSSMSVSGIGAMPRGVSEAFSGAAGPNTPATPAASGTGGGGAAAAATAATPADAGGAAAAGSGGAAVCSEFSAQLAEKLYSCAHHALVFLAATSPQLGEGEAASLGPAWPRPRDLAALLEQCMACSEVLAQHPASPPATQTRRAAASRQLARLGVLCGQWLSMLGQAAGGHGGGVAAAVGGHGGAREAAAREWLASLELTGAAGGGGGGGAMGMGHVPHAVRAV
ncbi:hypothetical protein GPECTOR_117g361 [Gonium pectorale]|uniref:Uncharacterized protein n=1 Tax=Gonium pectorale TaxID=33097 RepID=A0A150FYU8_GONPE|nr:hypothetical protein GPECTOR_117g361 [Gonium pectorale]|eukprot:KXZ42796.1 hypothetical protein GPECTOR_117g361 [Gonium pectorale]